jgi:hypothetical protein
MAANLFAPEHGVFIHLRPYGRYCLFPAVPRCFSTLLDAAHFCGVPLPPPWFAVNDTDKKQR